MTVELPRRSMDDMTVRYAKQYVRQHLKEGLVCPCCNQTAKIYKRSLTVTMARGLIYFRRYLLDNPKFENDFVHVNIVHAYGVDHYYRGGFIGFLQGGDFAKLRYWDLVESRIKTIDEQEADDGNPRSGEYKLTIKGRDFVDGKLKVPSHFFIYNSEVLQFDGKMIDIHAALKKKFNYNEIMGR